MKPYKLIYSLNKLEKGNRGFCKIATLEIANNNKNHEIGFYYEVINHEEYLILAIQMYAFNKYDTVKTMVFSTIEQVKEFLEKARKWAENELKTKLYQYGLTMLPHQPTNSYYKFYPQNKVYPAILRTILH